MSDKNGMSIAELDAKLEEDYKSVLQSMEEVAKPEDEVAEAVDEDPTDEEEAVEADEGEDGDVEEPEEDTKPSKPTKEDKEKFAFAKIRKEASDAKRALQEKDLELKEQNAVLTRLMKEAGYNDYKEFKQAIDTQLSAKEMKDKGYTKEQFSELETLRREKQQLTEETNRLKQDTYMAKVQNFDGLVKDYAKRSNSTSKEIYENLENLGYTVETLLAQPNPEILIKGIVADKLTPVVKSTPVKKSVDTEKLQTGSPKDNDSIDFDEIVKREMQEYKKRLGRT